MDHMRGHENTILEGNAPHMNHRYIESSKRQNCFHLEPHGVATVVQDELRMIRTTVSVALIVVNNA